MKRRKMKMIEMCFLALFAVILFSSVLFVTVFNMPVVSLALFLVDFPVAGITAVYASLSIREEEEEKTQAST
jgi:CHASE2 domain-containing sensor protein